MLFCTCSGPRNEASEKNDKDKSQTLAVWLDGEELATVSGKENPVPVAALIPVPKKSWLRIEAQSNDRRTLRIPNPATTYPKSTLQVYLHPTHGVSVGLFDEKSSTPNPFLVGASLVRIVTKEPEKALPRSIPAIAAGHSLWIPGEALATIPLVSFTRAKAGGKKRQAKKQTSGWSLEKLVEYTVDPRYVREVVLVTPKGSLSLLPPVLKTAIAKRNRRNSLVVEVYNVGEDGLADRAKRASDISHIELSLSKPALLFTSVNGASPLPAPNNILPEKGMSVRQFLRKAGARNATNATIWSARDNTLQILTDLDGAVMSKTKRGKIRIDNKATGKRFRDVVRIDVETLQKPTRQKQRSENKPAQAI